MRRQVALIISTLALVAMALGAPAIGAEPDTVSQYRIDGPKTWADRNAVARTGAALDYIDHGKIYVSATRSEAKAIQQLGFGLALLPPPATTSDVTIEDFPPADSNYHNFNEMITEINNVAAAYPNLVRVSTIGQSYQGRNIYAIKISDNV